MGQWVKPHSAISIVSARDLFKGIYHLIEVEKGLMLEGKTVYVTGRPRRQAENVKGQSK